MLIKQSRLGELFLWIKGHGAKIDATKTNPFFLAYLSTNVFGYFNTANNSVDIESKTAFMEIKSLKWLSKLNHVNRKYPLLRPFRWLIS